MKTLLSIVSIGIIFLLVLASFPTVNAINGSKKLEIEKLKEKIENKYSDNPFIELIKKLINFIVDSISGIFYSIYGLLLFLDFIFAILLLDIF